MSGPSVTFDDLESGDLISLGLRGGGHVIGKFEQLLADDDGLFVCFARWEACIPSQMVERIELMNGTEERRQRLLARSA